MTNDTENTNFFSPQESGGSPGAVLLVSFDHPGWENLRDSAELVRKSAIAFGTHLAPAFRKAAIAMTEFGDAIYSVAEKEYLEHHDKLPGGTSNARLRKKRRTMVFAWYWAHSPSH